MDRNDYPFHTVRNHVHLPLYGGTCPAPSIYSREMRAEHARRHHSQRTAQGYDPYNSADRFWSNVYAADSIDLDTICALPPRVR